MVFECRDCGSAVSADPECCGEIYGRNGLKELPCLKNHEDQNSYPCCYQDY
jgi:hypothetical protein